MRFLIARSLVASAALALGSATAQTTIHVPADWPTIQEAIVAAVDGDTVLVAPGTYVENLDYLGKAIAVESEAGASSTVVYAELFIPVVSFGRHWQSIEGADSILRGFTVTGGFVYSGGAGIDASGATPLIQDCIVIGNVSNFGPGGVYGSAILEDCRIESNAGANGGGFLGSPILRRCLVKGNTTDNLGGAGGASAGTLLESCTLVGNESFAFGGGIGGIAGVPTLTNCILQNEGQELTSANASYCCVEGGFAGTGNLDADPLFRDALNGDFHLLPGSPCIDAGSPSSPFDFDESRADVGALAFTHALATPRNGSGVNLPLLTSASAPALGTNLSLTVHAALVPQPAVSGITIKSRLLSPGVLTPFGELLVGGTTLGHAQQASNGVADFFTFAIPPSLALIGFEGFAQGYVIRQGTLFDLELGNALRLLIGQ